MGSQKYDKIVLRNKETSTHLHNSRFPKSNSPSTVQHLDRLKAWTYTAGAIARCFIKDIYEMVQQTGFEFYWLGRVPCRTVRIVGIVVGVDKFEDMTRFKVDDGTAVIDCECRYPRQPKPTLYQSAKDTRKSKPSYKSNQGSTSGTSFREIKIPEASVGQSINVKGNIMERRGSRHLRVEAGDFALCFSVNEEVNHWNEVMQLHRDFYSLSEPFTIPKIEKEIPKEILTTQSQSTTSTQSTSNDTNSARLRHPSRLKLQDLTPVRFRYYLKHYLDFAEPYHAGSCLSCPPNEIPSSRIQYKEPIDCNEHFFGFTLSYLRRVPALAEMALAVVHAERIRRGNGALTSQGKSQSSLTSSLASTSSARSTSQRNANSSEPSSAKAKRLFIKTIRDLHNEGSIIIWCGRIRPYSHVLHENNKHCFGRQSQTLGEDALGSSSIPSYPSTSQSSFQREEDEGELTEPEDEEEAYLSVRPETIAPLITAAIDKIQARKQGNRKLYRRPTAEDILKYLRATDGRWQNLGIWAIKETLKKM